MHAYPVKFLPPQPTRSLRYLPWKRTQLMAGLVGQGLPHTKRLSHLPLTNVYTSKSAHIPHHSASSSNNRGSICSPPRNVRFSEAVSRMRPCVLGGNIRGHRIGAPVNIMSRAGSCISIATSCRFRNPAEPRAKMTELPHSQILGKNVIFFRKPQREKEKDTFHVKSFQNLPFLPRRMLSKPEQKSEMLYLDG